MKNLISRKRRPARNPSRNRIGINIEALEQRAMLSVTAVGEEGAEAYTVDEGVGFTTDVVVTPVVSLGAMWSSFQGITRVAPNNVYPDANQLPTDWNDVAYNTATPSFGSWAAAAPAPFHVGTVDGLSGGTPLSTAYTGAGSPNVTALFRTNFMGDSTATGIRGTNLCDDGCAMYINGVLIPAATTPNMPNPITANGDAAPTRSETVFDTWSANLASLGVTLTNDMNNVFALELHQGAVGSSDIGFDASLSLELPGGQPGTRANDLFTPATAGNVASTFYADLTDPNPAVTRATTGAVRNAETDAVVGNVTVDPTTGNFAYTPTDANFNGTAYFPYILAELTSGGGLVESSGPVLALINVNSINTLPTTGADFYAGFEGQSLTISNTGSGDVLINTGATWSFLDQMTSVPAEAYPVDGALMAWNSENFNTATSDAGIGIWSSGPSPFAQGTINAFAAPTPLAGASATNTTYLFRNTFNLAAGTSAGIAGLGMNILADDSAIIYLNGVEVLRQNFDLARNPVLSTDFNGAGGIAGGAGNEDNYTYNVVSIPVGLLHDGNNSLAVELHQNSATSSDAGFDLVLTKLNAGLLANDSDVDGPAALTVNLATIDQSGLAAIGSVVVNANGTFTFTALPGAAGQGTFTYQAFDGTDNSAPTTVTIKLTSINNGPVVAVNDSGGAYDTVVEDTPKTFDGSNVPNAGGIGVGVLSNDTTAAGDENDPVTLIVVTQPANGTVAFLPANDGSFIYTPNANFNGIDSFTYRVDDGFPDASGNNIATVTLTVTPVDDAPTAVADSYSARQGIPLTISPTVATELVARGSSWSYFDQLNNGLQTNPASAAETYPLDGSGRAWNSVLFDTATSNAAIGAWQVGNALFAGPLDGLTPLGVTFLDGIDDAFNGTDNSVSTYLFRKKFTVADATGIQNLITETLADDGYVLYLNGVEVDRFGIAAGPVTTTTLASGNGDEALYVRRAVNVAGILVTGENTLAVELHQVNTTSSDAGFDMGVLVAAGVIANDTDPEGDAISNAVLTQQATSGTVVLNPNGTFTYTPTLATFVGTDTFQYTVMSGSLTSAAGTATITVTPVNNLPTANDDTYNAAVDETIEILNPAQGLLANDVSLDTPTVLVIDQATAQNGDAVDFPGQGTLFLTGATGPNDNRVGDGTFVFLPAFGFSGQVNYVYTIRDADGDTATATVTFNIGSTITFDIDGDGDIDRGDLAKLVSNYGIASGATNLQGDVNGDGKVNSADAILMRNRLGTAPPSPAAAVVTRAVDARAIDQAVARLEGVRTRLDNRDAAPRLQARVRQIVRDRVLDAQSNAGQAIDSALTSLRARRSANSARVASIVDQLFDS
ncbi:MAG: tandem-95 repeat protein [Pirellulales bacterium]